VIAFNAPVTDDIAKYAKDAHIHILANKVIYKKI